MPPVGGGGVSVRSIITGAGSAPGETSIESFGAGWPAGWLCQMGLALARERQIILNVYKLQHHPPPTAPVCGGGLPVPPVGGGGVSVRSIITGAGSAPGETSIESFGAG